MRVRATHLSLLFPALDHTISQGRLKAAERRIPWIWCTWHHKIWFVIRVLLHPLTQSTSCMQPGSSGYKPKTWIVVSAYLPACSCRHCQAATENGRRLPQPAARGRPIQEA